MLQDFYFAKLHGTGTSYIKALESEKLLTFNEDEQLMEYLKLLYSSFKTEKVGVFKRWEFFTLNFSYNIINCLENNDKDFFNSLFKGKNTLELGENKYFNIIITKISNKYDVKIKVFTFINLTESTAQFLSDDSAILMLEKKLNFLHK